MNPSSWRTRSRRLSERSVRNHALAYEPFILENALEKGSVVVRRLLRLPALRLQHARKGVLPFAVLRRPDPGEMTIASTHVNHDEPRHEGRGASASDRAMGVLLRSPKFHGRFVPLRKLGEGGMGAVYLVQDRLLDREVAIKVVLGSREEDRRRFQREGLLLARITHPNILRVFDTGVIGDVPYMATELVEGESLRVHLEGRRRLPPADAVSILLQVLEGLEAAHDQEVIHRDLKPENLVRLPDSRIKILDFGLARTMSSGGSRSGTFVTESGVVLGTPAYMAPEQ